MLRAMIATLFLSDGIPVLSAGDEYGHTRGRARRRAVDVQKRGERVSMGRRRRGRARRATARIHGGVRGISATTRGSVRVGGIERGLVRDGRRVRAGVGRFRRPDGADVCRRRATPPPGATPTPGAVTQDIVVAWNATGKLVTASIGQPPIGYAWVRVMDTALASPQDCALSYVNLAGPNGTYLVAPHAVLVLELAPAPMGMEPTAEQVAAAKRRAARIPDAARGGAGGGRHCGRRRRRRETRRAEARRRVDTGATGEAEHARATEHAGETVVPPAAVNVRGCA